jgi:hypothetical protein
VGGDLRQRLVPGKAGGVAVGVVEAPGSEHVELVQRPDVAPCTGVADGVEQPVHGAPRRLVGPLIVARSVWVRT